EDLLMLEGKNARLKWSPAQATVAKKVLGKKFSESETICVFDVAEIVESEDDDESHLDDLYEYFDLETIEQPFKKGTLVPFAALNIVGSSYPYAHAFQETSNHGLLCLDLAADGPPKVAWLYGSKVHPLAKSMKELSIEESDEDEEVDDEDDDDDD